MEHPNRTRIGGVSYYHLPDNSETYDQVTVQFWFKGQPPANQNKAPKKQRWLYGDHPFFTRSASQLKRKIIDELKYKQKTIPGHFNCFQEAINIIKSDSLPKVFYYRKSSREVTICETPWVKVIVADFKPAERKTVFKSFLTKIKTMFKGNCYE